MYAQFINLTTINCEDRDDEVVSEIHHDEIDLPIVRRIVMRLVRWVLIMTRSSSSTKVGQMLISTNSLFGLLQPTIQPIS
jgi:hypothetical protein